MTLIEKLGFSLGLILVLGLLFMMVFSTNGVMDYRELKQKEDQVKIQAGVEAGQNRKMEEEIRSLKHDANYIKHLAKHEHEMAEPDELIFKEKNPTKDPKP